MSSCGPESEQILRSVQKQIRSQCFRKGEETDIPAAESIADLSVAEGYHAITVGDSMKISYAEILRNELAS